MWVITYNTGEDKNLHSYLEWLTFQLYHIAQGLDVTHTK